MTVRRLIAIAVIFLGTAVGWTVLGSSLVARSGEFDARLSHEVNALWGGAHRQVAPTAVIERMALETEVVETADPAGQLTKREVTKTRLRATSVPLESTKAAAHLELEHRQKGLLWFATYEVRFQAEFRFRNPDAEARTMRIRLPLPAQDALFDDVVLLMNGQPVRQRGNIGSELLAEATVEPGAPVTFDVRYRSRGLGTWTFAFAPEGVAQVRDFTLTLTTNFTSVDFPAGTLSPSERIAQPRGERLVWRFDNLITGQAIGLELPERLNPGPFAARVTFFAPVSLLFFIAVMVMVGVTSGHSLHPMHYWFLSAAFFAFHLLLAYLVDHIPVHAAFLCASAVSLFLVISYLRIVTGMRRALREAGAAQVIFLVLFSYAFFFEGFTGLAVTVGAIVTLFVMMQMTATVSWEAVFARDRIPGTRAGGEGRDVN